MSRPYAEVIGDPIAQSKSPLIHNFWLGKLGIDAEYRACHVTESALARYLTKRRSDPAWRGCNVTMPHKQTVMPLLDSIEEQARSIGAVNTIRATCTGDQVGMNTDAAGFIEPLREVLGQIHLFRMARVLGTGGAARAIVRALIDEKFVIVLAGRDPAKARALLAELDPGGEHHAVALGHFADSTDFAFDDRANCSDLIVNASPLGMRGQPALDFDWSHAPPGAIAYDIVTNPIETPFLTAAKTAGHLTIDGLAMLIGQAAAAFELFFDQPAPREHDDELRALLTS